MADVSFDYFDHPQQRKQNLGLPISLYDPADFSGDSSHSPDSPLSPVFANPYQLPVANEWVNWDDKATLSPDLDALPKQEPFEGINLSTIPSRNTMELSPAINPNDLAGTIPDAVPFGRVGLNDIDTQPLFQTPMSSISPQPHQLHNSMMPTTSNTMPMSAAMAAKDARNRYPSRKRKSSGSGSVSSHSSPSPPPATRRHCSPPKKTAHNMIEKRYRTNLNDKIAALRDSVPALRVMVHRLEQPSPEGVEDDLCEEDLGGLAPAHKLNKATILSKATEYIAHLEKKNKSLARENNQLRNRVEGFEMLVMSRDQAPPPGVWA
ncbi:hypothetical protein EDB81DRAFT_204195 [Dactylonectria macrodidyma]|uniref:BHLH domain-containing protein n=1 Tax=Dactylonectria macrodidyma TaxID=307937 RepID=A0A9P9DW67_9HYPO|nr:hypothetical protein EDB81DRAFT_204195 [Dactylonectria macrodidyma]